MKMWWLKKSDNMLVFGKYNRGWLKTKSNKNSVVSISISKMEILFYKFLEKDEYDIDTQ